MRKHNKFLTAGLFIIALMLTAKQFVELPDFIQGLGYGMGIALELIGCYLVNHDISKLRNFKKNLMRGMLGGRK